MNALTLSVSVSQRTPMRYLSGRERRLGSGSATSASNLASSCRLFRKPSLLKGCTKTYGNALPVSVRHQSRRKYWFPTETKQFGSIVPLNQEPSRRTSFTRPSQIEG